MISVGLFAEGSELVVNVGAVIFKESPVKGIT